MEAFVVRKIIVLAAVIFFLVGATGATSGAETTCSTGSYLKLTGEHTENYICVPCSRCPIGFFESQQCHRYSDTVCSLGKNNVTVVGENDAPESTIVYCGPGHYLNETANSCLPCPNNTYMSKKEHQNYKCRKCETETHPQSHLVPIKPCNSNNPTLFDCEPGYYGHDVLPDNRMKFCDKCTNCSCELRKCTAKADAACCEDTTLTPYNKTSELTSSAAPTTSTSGVNLSCPAGYYVDISNQTCKPCTDGTYMDEVNHTRTACMNTSEFNRTTAPSAFNEETNKNTLIKILVPLALIIIILVIIIIIIYIRRKMTNNCGRVILFCQSISSCCKVPLPNDESGHDNNNDNRGQDETSGML